MEIIKYKKEYLKDLIEIFVESFNNSSWHDKWTNEIVYKHLSQLTTTMGFQGLIAIENNNVVGMILGIEHYTFNAKTFIIKEFCMSSMVKGKGFGLRLLDKFECELKEQGFKNIQLQTLNSPDILGFYEKNGYIEDSLSVYMEKNIY